MIEALKKIPLTFYSRSFYSDFIRNGRGIGGGFICLLILINFLGIAIPAAIPLYRLGGQLQELIDMLPVTTVKDGKISIDKPAPYKIEFPMSEAEKESKRPAAFVEIDPGYIITDLDLLEKKMQSENITLLVTDDKIVTRSKSGEVKISPLRSLPETVITQEKWTKVGILVRNFLVLFLMLFVFVGIVIKDFVAIFLGGAIIKIVGLFNDPDFSPAMRLAAAAAIPGAIVFALLQRPIFWASFMLWLAYVIYGLWSYRKTAAP